MTIETNIKVEGASDNGDREQRLVVGAVNKLMLAAIGAVGLAQDALENLLDRAVTRGELSQKEARQMMQQMRAKSRRRFQKGAPGQTLSGMSMETPSKADIQSLHDEIAALSAKLDQIKMERPSSSQAMPKVDVTVSTPPKPSGM